MKYIAVFEIPDDEEYTIDENCDILIDNEEMGGYISLGKIVKAPDERPNNCPHNLGWNDCLEEIGVI